MYFPSTLQEAVDQEIDQFDWNVISKAREELSERYRGPASKSKQGHFMTTDAHRCAYIASRLPATYAVNHRVLTEVRQRLPNLMVKSFLDLGAGPGTSMWAASDVFPEIETVELLEKDAALASIGKRLASKSEHAAVHQARWNIEDLSQVKELQPHDMVILSYSIGELSEAARFALLHASWQAARQCLVIIEPGTPAGFDRIRQLRSELMAIGGHLVAPCPHELACPMTTNDWCHFSERIERSFYHRKIKSGSLSYEDEKFSYIVASKTPCELPKSRILRDPMRRSGHICLSLCTPKGAVQETVSKKKPEAYKQARKAEWGSTFDFFDS